MRCLTLWLLITLPTGSLAETLTFQEGVGGYSGTEDLHLAISADFHGNGHRESQFATDPDNPQWVWDPEATWGEGTVSIPSGSARYGVADNVGLLRFRKLFGDQPGQIPPGATISSATLTLRPDNPITKLNRKPGDAANLHEVLIDWDESVRWGNFGVQAGPDIGSDFDNEIIANTGLTDVDLMIDVTQSVSGWSLDPASNRGWLLMPAATQDIISPTGSALANVTSVLVDLEISSPNRGELVVTLRHGDYTALLVNRIQSGCSTLFGSQADDIDVTLDDAAPSDIHSAPNTTEPLTGTWNPDSFCIDIPICTGGGTGGLCGQPANGDWVLNVTDEYNNANPQAVLVSWGITLSDGITQEIHDSSPGLTVNKRHKGSSFDSAIWSSENPTPALRPELSVTFVSTPVFTPTVLTAHPAAGLQDVSVRIPDGSNAASAVTVTVVSDDTNVVSVPGSPLVFAQGGPTSQSLQLSIGVAGSATLTATNDAALGNALLPVTVAIDAIAASPEALYRIADAADESMSVTIPFGSNASAAVNVTVSSDNTSVADLLGGTGGSLGLTFAAGAATMQNVTVQFGAGIGTGNLTASDDGSVLASTIVPVALSSESPVEVDVTIEPYLQLGDAPLGAASDQVLIAWQSTLRKQDGPNADRFTVETRKVGEPTWVAASLGTPVQHGSTSRLNQSATITGLDFDEQYDYRVIHLRNEVAIATYQDVHVTRPTTGPFRFTAFGNSGQGNSSQDSTAALMAAQDPDFHLMLGDHIYNDGEYEYFRPRMSHPYGTTQADTPFLFAMGNHDSQTDVGQPTLDYFFVPENGPPALPNELNYSFDYGDVHFAVINSGSGLNSANMENLIAPWLAADLAASTKTWKVVATHEPPVTRDPFGIDRQESASVRDFILKAAVENGADLFLAGATHSYQRYLPITAVIPTEPYVEWSTCEAGFGTTLVYPGTGSWALGAPPVTEALELPMLVYEDKVGVGVFDVSGSTLTVEFTGSSDQVVLNNCTAPANCPCPGCGNVTLDPGEQCDDGNSTPGDGCSDTCQYENSFKLFGLAQGGTIELTISGVLIVVVTTSGQTPDQVMVALAAAVNADPALMGLGITATNVGNQVITNGTIDSLVSTDPGLRQQHHLPAMGPLGSLLLSSLLVLSGVFAVRLRGVRRLLSGHPRA